MKLFIYGTLKRGYCNNHILKEYNAKWLGKATTCPGYILIDLGCFPGLIRPTRKVSRKANSKIGGNKVFGEVWEVDDECLKRLDQFESGLYERGPIELMLPFEADNVESYFYIGKVGDGPYFNKWTTI